MTTSSDSFMTTVASLVPTLLALACLALAPHRVHAQERSANTPPVPADLAAGTAALPDGAAGQAEPTAVELDELRRRIDVLAAELEQLRSGEQETTLSDDKRRALGLAPSAAATYRRASPGISFAGYGEMLYERRGDRAQDGQPLAPSRQLDMLRFVLYTGYRFGDRFVFNSEVELEHANEVSVEFAYLDYLASPNLTVRAGMVLLPLGLVNEFHEPNVFLGARRPETESRIIPSTWRENGAGVLGSSGPFQYRVFVVNGLNALGFSAQGVRGGRQKGSRANAVDLAVAGRLDVVPTPGLFFGGAVYTGGSAQGQLASADDPRVATTIAEVHGQVQVRGFDLRGLYAKAFIGDVVALNSALTTGRPIARRMAGGYAQIGYNVLSQVTERAGVIPYYRYERVNTQENVPSPFLPNNGADGSFHTAGVEFRPIYNIVVKTDYQWVRNRARTGRDQFNINLGYAF